MPQCWFKIAVHLNTNRESCTDLKHVSLDESWQVTICHGQTKLGFDALKVGEHARSQAGLGRLKCSYLKQATAAGVFEKHKINLKIKECLITT
jgi:hypothetical protein